MGHLTTTTFLNQSLVLADANALRRIVTESENDLLGRARICLHNAESDAIHEMLIAMRRGTYVRPKRGIRMSKSWLIFSGKLLFLRFDDLGTVIAQHVLGNPESELPFILRLNEDAWHGVFPLTEVVTVLETHGGPFIRESEIYAPWAPYNDDIDGISAYMTRLNIEQY